MNELNFFAETGFGTGFIRKQVLGPVFKSGWDVEVVVEGDELFLSELNSLFRLFQVGDVLDQVD